MKTKKLLIIGICLFSSLVLGKESYATTLDQEGIVQSKYAQDILFTQESTLQNELSQPINTTENEEKVVEFRDHNLEEAVKTELGIPYDQELTASSMLNLRKIQPTVTGITDLTGLEYAKNLQVITFNDNVLQSLKPIENLPNLTSIGLVNSPYLTIEDITNSLSTLDVIQLDLSNNSHIGDFSKLSIFTNLRGLWLNNCNLKNADFLENMTHLTMLSLNNNSLTTVHQLNSQFIRTLLLNQNHLVTLDDIHVLSSVSNLQINNNELTSLSHLNFDNLIALQANSNNITSLEGFHGTALTALSLDDNQIKSVENMNAPVLSELLIRNNRLENLNGLENSPMLITLIVSSNKINDLRSIKNLPRLIILSIQDNLEIDDFTPISFSKNLTQLFAFNTNANNKKVRQLGELKSLDILAVSNLDVNSANEKITNLDFLNQFPALTGFAADGHAISDISKLGDYISTYSALHQIITLPEGISGQETPINLVDKRQEFPSTVQFITSGELIKDPSQNKYSVMWNQTGNNSFTFSSSDNFFSGTVNQHISIH